MNGRKTNDFLLDSNIFLRSLIQDNKSMGQDCVALFKAIGEGTISVYVPTLVIAEVQYVLHSFYGFDRDHIATVLKSISATVNLRIFDDLELSSAISFYEKANVKFVDCYLASSKRVFKGQASIISYNRDFDRLGVTRVEPSQLLRKIKT